MVIVSQNIGTAFGNSTMSTRKRIINTTQANNSYLRYVSTEHHPIVAAIAKFDDFFHGLDVARDNGKCIHWHHINEPLCLRENTKSWGKIKQL